MEPSSHTCHACALAQFNLASRAFRAQICSTCVSDAHREFRILQVSASPLKDWQDKLGGGGRMSAPQEGLLWIHSPCLLPPSSPAVGGMSSISHPTLKWFAFVETSLWSCDSHQTKKMLPINVIFYYRSHDAIQFITSSCLQALVSWPSKGLIPCDVCIALTT